ncbi:MAG: hypothetical protein AB1611_07100 [bacterium]
MKFFPKWLFAVIMLFIAAAVPEGLLPGWAEAQFSPLSGYYGYYNYLAPFQAYGYGGLGGSAFINPHAGLGWGGMNPFSGSLTSWSPWYGGGYFGNGLSLMSPFSYGNGYQTLMEAFNTYNYLQYAIQFYEIAREVPLLYLQDTQADHLGALMYSYADKLGVSPQEAVLYFIRENFFPQP